MNPQNATLARRYAQAFLNTVETLDDEEIGRCVELERVFREQPKLLFLLSSPLLKPSVRHEHFSMLFKPFRTAQQVISLSNLLIAHGRFKMMPDVLMSLVHLYREQRGVVFYVVTSSHELVAEVRHRIDRWLERMTLKRVMTVYHVDASLIAGLRIQSDERLWEYSIRKAVRQLKSVLE